uniref:Uncharacterized protein n=1 Tax=Arundo donax TaxID=35708 RepID=A0A0A9GUQ5_ARUDO
MRGPLRWVLRKCHTAMCHLIIVLLIYDMVQMM